MKKVILFSLIILSILVLAACSSSSTGTGVVGTWQSKENPDFQLELTQAGKFQEHLSGQVVGYGDYQVDGSTLSMHYSSPCGGANQVTCDLEIGYTLSGSTLVITDNQGQVHFSKVGE